MRTSADLPFHAVGIETVIGVTQQGLRGAGMGALVLDACRDAALPTGFRSGTRGLANPVARDDFLIAYSTQARQVADDGAGPLSPYTGNLVARLGTPGEQLSDTSKRVREAVVTATAGL